MNPLSVPPAPQRAVDVFLRYLVAEKVDTVFGVAGGLAYPLFLAVEQSADIRFIMTKHEQGAAFMADGYARVGRRLGVCVGTSGPGSTNLITGVACAFADGVPLLVITGQAQTDALGRGAAQETPREDIDIVAMFQPITKYSAMVTNAQSFSRHVRRALRTALSGRQGPVHLNVPVDLWDQKIIEDWFDPLTYRGETRMFDRQAVLKAGDLLMEAHYPVILAGSGIASANAEQHLIELTQLIDAKVVTTPRAKGIFPEDVSASLGVLGTAGHSTARDVVLGTHVDVLFCAGTSLSETTTFNWSTKLRPSKALIHLDIDADRIGRNYPADVPLIGDAQSVLTEILYHVHRRIREGGQPRSQWPGWRLPDSSSRFMTPQERTSNELPLKPQRWRTEIEEVLPNDAIIFSDIGGHMLFNIHHLTIKSRQRFIINLGFGSMGHGTLAPIGAAVCGTDRRIFAIVGDGCFHMNGMDLLTAVEYQIPVIWIVENNQMHGISWHSSRIISGTSLAATKYRVPVDIASIAKAMGLNVKTVDGPGQIASATKQLLAMPGPGLIDVRVDPSSVPPLDERNQALAGFINR